MPSRPGEAAFTLDLSDDVREMRDWVHEFAANVMRPAAAEWDEREETPWPILEEASKIGLYSLDFFGGQWFEPTGLGTPVAFEEIFWGDAGIGLALTGSCLAAVAVSGSGTPEQIGEWLPQMFGSPGDVKLGAFCSSEPDAGSDVGAIRTRAVYSEATDEWVLNGTKAWATNGGIADVHVVVASVDPALGSRGQASFIVPPGTHGAVPGAEVPQARRQGLAHRRGGARRRPGARPVPGRRQGPAGRQAGQAGWRPGRRRAGRDEDVRGVQAHGRRDGGRRGQGSLRVRQGLLGRAGSSSASRSGRTRRSPSCSPTCRPRSTRPGC